MGPRTRESLITALKTSRKYWEKSIWLAQRPSSTQNFLQQPSIYTNCLPHMRTILSCTPSTKTSTTKISICWPYKISLRHLRAWAEKFLLMKSAPLLRSCSCLIRSHPSTSAASRGSSCSIHWRPERKKKTNILCLFRMTTINEKRSPSSKSIGYLHENVNRLLPIWYVLSLTI